MFYTSKLRNKSFFFLFLGIATHVLRGPIVLYCLIDYLLFFSSKRTLPLDFHELKRPNTEFDIYTVFVTL